ncbi:hypothetical protein M4I21_17595 [Cellulophaga sp. 20_2_10]|uniref:hypothetical protein n=1 Tax=Cellulophaga sp. 20_2_10 TaxID=2942476 RepID=UPI00201AD7B4|nr:hypothetical protein [Cellulophaga sp. 20_2_10]MCL5247636.1 hypothetical protein [Cellulophaga sp. 20_2_10]
MKLYYITFLLLVTLSVKAQESTNDLINKSFSTKVGYMCQETDTPNPCAGQQIYLELKFKKEKVVILEKYVSSCNKVNETEIGQFKWSLLKNNEVKIYSDSEKIKYTYLKNLKLELSNKVLVGEKIWEHTEPEKYVFIENNTQD